MSQSQIVLQSFADVQQQLKELRVKYTGELEKLQAETRLLLAEQQRKNDLLSSRFSYDVRHIALSVHLLSKQFDPRDLDSTSF